MKYVSLLRGINVSGQKKIKMADLKDLYRDLGFDHPQTYIQSGNVVFDSRNRSKATLRTTIEQGILARFGFEVAVEVRSGEELRQAIQHCPFDDLDLEKEASRVLLCFLAKAPSKAAIERITPFIGNDERLVFGENVAYLHCPQGHGKSKLSNNLLEQKLGMSATTRNWRTVGVLFDMTHTD